MALRKALELDPKYRTRFDFFAVDFDEELSAVSGSVLIHQHRFVVRAIDRILALYKGGASKPKSVVLVGHSIGGVVAKSVFLAPPTPVEGRVKTIITMATPHDPVLLLDW